MPDKMGFEFTGTQKGDIITGLDVALTTLNSIKVVQLTPTERKGAQSIAEGRLPYVHNAINNLAPAYPNLQPPFLQLSEANINATMAYDIEEILLKVKEILDRFTDFGLASEHFAYQYVRKFYSIAKEGQEVSTPGADTVVSELSPLFEGQGASNAGGPDTEE
jgi:hypothetical protein